MWTLGGDDYRQRVDGWPWKHYLVTLEYTTREAPTANSYSDTGNRTFRDILKNEPGGVRDKEREVRERGSDRQVK